MLHRLFRYTLYALGTAIWVFYRCKKRPFTRYLGIITAIYVVIIINRVGEWQSRRLYDDDDVNNLMPTAVISLHVRVYHYYIASCLQSAGRPYNINIIYVFIIWARWSYSALYVHNIPYILLVLSSSESSKYTVAI